MDFDVGYPKPIGFAKAMDELLVRLTKQDTPESRTVGLRDWHPRPGDVIVATPPKCGGFDDA
jgi:hypothetical protein